MSAQSAMEALQAAGSPGLAQGAYGEHGNLELVCPAPEGGFWVLWFDVEWHFGLHVAGAPRSSARITQVEEGPRFLEVVGRTGTAVERHFWTPTDGFVAAAQVALSDADPSGIVAHEGAFSLLCHESGSVVRVAAATAAYPALEWAAADVVCEAPQPASVDLCAVAGSLVALVVADGTAALHTRAASRWQPLRTLPGRWREAVLTSSGGEALVVGIDEHGEVVRCGPDDSLLGMAVVADAVTATVSTLDGGTLEIVTRAGTALSHTRVGVRKPSPPP